MNDFFNKNQNVPLIKVEQKDGNPIVSARELYQFLEVQTDFTHWCKRMFEYDFTENQDYSRVTVKNDGNSKGGKSTLIDYALTLDTAKEIAMIQRTEKGKQARQYFIECEKELTKNKSNIDLIIESAMELKRQQEQIRVIQEKHDEAEAYMDRLKEEPIRAMQVTTRKALDNLVKSYAVSNGVGVPVIYSMLYREFALRYNSNVNLNASRAKMSQIGWIEQNGYIADVYEIAKEILVQKGGAR